MHTSLHMYIHPLFITRQKQLANNFLYKLSNPYLFLIHVHLMVHAHKFSMLITLAIAVHIARKINPVKGIASRSPVPNIKS